MIRTCIVDVLAGMVVNVVEYTNETTGVPPGMDEKFLAVPSLSAQIGWLWTNGQLNPAPSSEPIEEVKAKVWIQIKSVRDHIKSGGVKVGTKWFHTDDASRIQHMALNMMGANIPANLQWKTMDGSFVTMTQSLAGQVFQAVALLDMQAFAKAEEHRIAMEASNDPASYDFSAGWPASFEG